MDSFCVVNWNVSEVIMLKECALIDQELTYFDIASRSGEMQRSSLILVMRVDIIALNSEWNLVEDIVFDSGKIVGRGEFAQRSTLIVD